jgi:hypothetical protein
MKFQLLTSKFVARRPITLAGRVVANCHASCIETRQKKDGKDALA